MKINSKIINLLLLPIALLSVTGCGGSNKKEYTKYAYSFSFTTEGKTFVSSGDHFCYDKNIFIDTNPTDFNQNLLKIGALSTGELSGFPVTIYTSDGQAYKGGAPTTTMKFLGFEDIKLYDNSSFAFSIDSNDVTSFFIGHLEIENSQVFFVEFFFTSNGQEWASNLDVGVNNSDYMKSKDEHPEWSDTDNHKGFDVTTNRAIKLVEEYCTQYQVSDKEKIFYITGHSRGATIADMLAYKITPRYKTFAYTFCAPNNTFSNKANSMHNIFNFTNTDDIVTNLPSTNVGAKVYGQRITYSMSAHLDFWNTKAPGIIYEASEQTTKSFNDAINKVFVSRESAYKLPVDKHKGCYIAYESQAEAMEAMESFKKLVFKDPVKQKYSIIGPVEQIEGKYCLYLDCSPAFILSIIEDCLIDPSKISTILSDGYISFVGRYMEDVASLITLVLSSKNFENLIAYPHHAFTYMLALELLYKE